MPAGVFKNPKELLGRISQLRRDQGIIRSEVAMRTVLGLQYINSKHWTALGHHADGRVFADTWDEDWSPSSSEIRVVDNKTAPLVRRIAASVNATSIESAVQPPIHNQSFEASDQASVAQEVLNSLGDSIGLTQIARAASSLRWAAGSSLLLLKQSQKRRNIPTDVAQNPDGSPMEFNDKWLRWDYAPLSDLIWEPSNSRWDLGQHSVLILERVRTVREFIQEYGPLDKYGLTENDLPNMSELAPHYAMAAEMAGSMLFNRYQHNSQTKGIRVLSYMETDENDPNRWPTLYNVIDTSNTNNPLDDVSGIVINFDNPENPYGDTGRFIFKLDAFRRDDAVMSNGAPHVLMGDQDRLNIIKSYQLEQLASVVHGMWLVDETYTDAETFANDLSERIGGILKWHSDGRTDAKPPTWVNPNSLDQAFVTLSAEASQGMRDQVHISPANQGIGKSHVPQKTQQLLLQESNVVVDNITTEDTDIYSDALKATLGTVRKIVDSPSRMIARLRDQFGFDVSDLQVLKSINPSPITLRVRVRRHSIESISINEKVRSLGESVADGTITPIEKAIAMTEELERPILISHEKQLQFCQRAVRFILGGFVWPGVPNLNPDFFEHTANNAMWGLDIRNPEQAILMQNLQKAIIIQKQLFLENNIDPAQQGGLGSQSGTPTQSPTLPPPRFLTGNGSSGGGGGGAPESINPLSNPVGAAGGLPLGLS